MANIHHVKDLCEPPFMVTEYLVEGKRPSFVIKCVDESILLGGTKQRLLSRLVRGLPHDEMVYAGIACAYGAIALGVCCKLYDKKCTWFVDAVHQNTEMAEALGVTIRVVRCPRRDGAVKLTDLYDVAAKYVGEQPTRYLVPFGMISSKAIEELYVDCLADCATHQIKRLWVTVSSGSLARILRRLLPDTELMLVQVGRNVWEPIPNAQMFRAPYAFADVVSSDAMPPYDSPAYYDAKVWRFVQTYGKESDYVWNTAGTLTWAKIQRTVDKINELITWCRLRTLPPTIEWPSMCVQMNSPEEMFSELKRLAKTLPADRKVESLFNEHYYTATGMSNHYTESARMNCVTEKMGLSPKVFWGRHRDTINKLAFEIGRPTDDRADQIVPDHAGAMDMIGNIQRLYNKRGYAECQTFNPLILFAVIKRHFIYPAIKTLTVLDPSIGHGDRLAACLALGVKSYEGFDPNTELRPGLIRLVEAHREHTEVTLHFAKFPRSVGKSYNVVFTSPPFHSLEKYPGSLEDAALPFKEWVARIYKPYVISAALSVAPGGILALYITDLPGRPLATLTMELVAPTLEFVENIIYSGSYIDPIGRKVTSYDKYCLVWRPYMIPPGY